MSRFSFVGCSPGKRVFFRSYLPCSNLRFFRLRLGTSQALGASRGHVNGRLSFSKKCFRGPVESRFLRTLARNASIVSESWALFGLVGDSPYLRCISASLSGLSVPSVVSLPVRHVLRGEPCAPAPPRPCVPALNSGSRSAPTDVVRAPAGLLATADGSGFLRRWLAREDG